MVNNTLDSMLHLVQQTSSGRNQSYYLCISHAAKDVYLDELLGPVWDVTSARM